MIPCQDFREQKSFSFYKINAIIKSIKYQKAPPKTGKNPSKKQRGNNWSPLILSLLYLPI